MSLVKCTECNQEISSAAKTCPHCGKNRQGWVSRHKFLTFLIILIIVISVFTDFWSGFYKGFKNEFNKSQQKSIENNYEFNNTATFKDQLEFHDFRKNYYSKYKEGENDIQKSDVFNNAEERTLTFAKDHDWNFKDWLGEITDIETEKGGEKLFITVSSEQKGQKIKYTTSYCAYSCGIKKNNEVYDMVRELNVGQKVFFSGKFIKNKRGKVDELSVTEWGSMLLPEYKIDFNNIKPYTNDEHFNSNLIPVLLKKEFEKSKNNVENEYIDCWAVNTIKGDLNNDGKDEGIVQYACGSKDGGAATMGLGWFVFINNNGKMDLLLIDNEDFKGVPKSIREDGVIVSLFSDYGPDDARCCPTMDTIFLIELREKTLVIIEKIPVDD